MIAVFVFPLYLKIPVYYRTVGPFHGRATTVYWAFSHMCTCVGLYPHLPSCTISLGYLALFMILDICEFVISKYEIRNIYWHTITMQYQVLSSLGFFTHVYTYRTTLMIHIYHHLLLVYLFRAKRSARYI